MGVLAFRKFVFRLDSLYPFLDHSPLFSRARYIQYIYYTYCMPLPDIRICCVKTVHSQISIPDSVCLSLLRRHNIRSIPGAEAETRSFSKQKIREDF